MAALPKPSVVLFVANVPKLCHFYRQVAAMTVLHADDTHAVLELEGFQLVIHLLSNEPEVPSKTPGDISVREDAYWKLCLPVMSLAAARKIASDLGGWIRPPEHEWEARGFRACDGNDPEGNVIQLREEGDHRNRDNNPET